MRPLASLSVPALICLSALAQSPDAATILSLGTDALRQLNSFHLEATTVMQQSSPDYDQTIKSKLSIAYENPGKFRVEMKGIAGMTKVSDGAETWTYNALLKQYTKTQSTQSLNEALEEGPAGLFPREGAPVKSVRLAGEEDLRIGSETHPCYVLEVEYNDAPRKEPNTGGATKFWVDKSTHFVLKSEISPQRFLPGGGAIDMKVTVTVDSLQLNQSIAPSLFTFIPPSSAKQVDSFAFGGVQKSNLIGTTAPQFKLEDLSGQKFELSSLRGKTVLLDFWATWCGPCREEIPSIEKLHRENQDLTVLGVDVGEDASVVRKFVGENKMTYPVLLAGNDRVVELYQFHALPSVVIIDKDGVIRNYMTGYGPEMSSQLQSVVTAAGKPGPASTFDPAKVFQIGGGVTAPSVTYKVEPNYSERARKERIAGSVRLSIVVSPDGNPVDIRVVKPLDRDLDQKAIEAVSTWRFKPGMKDGQPVAVRANIEVSFKLLHNPALPTEAAPTTSEDAYRCGMRLIREKQTDQGIALLNTAISMRPDWAQAYQARARAEYQEKKYAEAIEDFNNAIRLDPKRASWYSQRGLALSYSGHHEQAIEDYSRAIEMAPDSSATYNDRGWGYTELDRPEKGIQDLTKAIEMSPDYQKAYENRAKAYLKLKDWVHAIQDLTSAIELNPNAWAYRQRAEAKRSSGDETGAAADTQKADDLAKPPVP